MLANPSMGSSIANLRSLRGGASSFPPNWEIAP